REREVLGLLSHGLTTQQIADRLERSYWTVRIHQQNIVAKMGARDRTHAACMAVVWEMVWEGF
ncbi:MAG: helix-turn-helix transcriptional regulator, partial [Chloroflexi bacterium]|nr:helix-turn-helix transcriptional regulator [Chloroflexota bacterium]